MTITHSHAQETGGIYVEAAIILPVLLLVVFASIFFFLVAARHFSLQMLANDIASDISLSLGPRFGVNFGDRASCGKENSSYPPTTSPTPSKLDLTDMLRERYTNSNGCWNVWAREQYLLATHSSGADPSEYLTVSLNAHPTLHWFDEPSTQTMNSVAIGDFIEVEVRYPAKAILGGGIAMFGATPDISIVGTAIAVLERPSR